MALENAPRGDGAPQNLVTVAALAARYGLKKKAHSDSWLGANPWNPAGAQDDGFELFDSNSNVAPGQAYDRKLAKHYTIKEVAELSCLRPSEYEMWEIVFKGNEISIEGAAKMWGLHPTNGGDWTGKSPVREDENGCFVLHSKDGLNSDAPGWAHDTGTHVVYTPAQVAQMLGVEPSLYEGYAMKPPEQFTAAEAIHASALNMHRRVSEQEEREAGEKKSKHDEAQRNHARAVFLKVLGYDNLPDSLIIPDYWHRPESPQNKLPAVKLENNTIFLITGSSMEAGFYCGACGDTVFLPIAGIADFGAKLTMEVEAQIICEKCKAKATASEHEKIFRMRLDAIEPLSIEQMALEVEANIQGAFDEIGNMQPGQGSVPLALIAVARAVLYQAELFKQLMEPEIELAPITLPDTTDPNFPVGTMENAEG